ncbi:SDR family oxidoreductase [Tersicoccus sp. Bi-70]|uniref:SDR family NAD(P)-dependent oxidoreductase n=1 Tax=Tersicoccus sp. Bi-70 TaxID=1897634 RepID=UPI000978BFCB|nr:SDR family oxidoreductase [Tersicoccus sp. Bi-70]OMH32337.1 short-chain dehydrogenase [Tersicoccus sp. Bi-70]
MSTALVTGASAGLGAEFARQLAAAGHDLVLVARDEARLTALAADLQRDHGVRAEVLPADLVTDEGLAAVRARIEQAADPVTVLVNNAGYGIPTDFVDTALADEQRMLQLLVEVPMALSHVAIPVFAGRGGGHIVNVSSVAGFIPRGTYGAAKAWLTSFSRWANTRYRSRGVVVTAVCPGLVRTEFHGRMKVDTRNVPGFAWLDAPLVVREGLAAAFAGRAVVVPSKRYRTVVALSKALPDRLMAAAGRLGH